MQVKSADYVKFSGKINHNETHNSGGESSKRQVLTGLCKGLTIITSVFSSLNRKLDYGGY